MKANEFVKKYGVSAAKNILHGMDGASEFTAHMPGDAWDEPTLVDAVCLRRLVESHELVEKLGGIAKTKEAFGLCVFRNRASYAKRVEQAIADVESCMEVS